MQNQAVHRVLFVCLGNICRSPAAEGVLKTLVSRLPAKGAAVYVASAGTEGWHTGKPPDPRMVKAAARRGYDLTSRARQFSLSDFRDFDLILAMDESNYRDIQRLDPQQKYTDKLRLFCELCPEANVVDVPDPYDGGEEAFEEVLDLLESGCENLLRQLMNSGGTGR